MRRLMPVAAWLILQLACDPRGPEDTSGVADTFGWIPSNIKLEPDTFEGLGDVVIDVDGECTVNAIAEGQVNCGVDPAVYASSVQRSDEGDLVVIAARSLTIAEGSRVVMGGTAPTAFVVSGDVRIDGEIVVPPGAAGGGAPSGSSPDGFGPGAGRASTTSDANGGGGSYCGRGGHAGDGTGGEATPYGNPWLVPLQGGSSGGGLFAGAGGGAVQISAAGDMAIAGTITAPGQGADNVDAGGGSGGAILLEATRFELTGTLAANGGGGATDSKVDGEDGQPSAEPAAGGTAEGQASGGAGGAGDRAAGEPGEPYAGTLVLAGGSGGGGVGRIRISVVDDQYDVEQGVISPARTTLCATLGAVEGWEGGVGEDTGAPADTGDTAGGDTGT